MADQIRDERFSHISSDPQFRATPKSVRKVKIDKRFQSLFTDKRFQLKYSVDKRGRPIEQSSNENFRKYYEISTEESSDESGSDEKSNDLNSERNEGQQQNKSNVSNCKIRPDSSKKHVMKGTNWVVTPTSKLKKEDNESSEVTDEDTLKTDSSKDINKKLKKSENPNIEINAGDLIDKARMTDEVKVKLKDPNIDYARGMGTLLSDSSSEESSSDSESEDGEVEHNWGELDKDAETTDEATERLAVLHMDWDRIRAVDLMVLFNSFLPPEGMIKSVAIYPSEFGLERMKEEEAKGPIELTTMKVENDEDLDEESRDGKRYHMERLRQYQLNRLKYYYAVIHFDSVDTANKVYTECDNLEYESSSTKLDLRFVPEEETFDQEPHEVCTSLPDPAKYKPRLFTNSALQQGKVELTWDETDPGRQEFTNKILKNADNVDNADLDAYLAHSSEDEENDGSGGDNNNKEDTESEQEDVKEDDKIAKYKFLLASLEEEEENKKQRDVDLEITWGVGLKEKAEKAVKDKLSTPKTPFEEMLDKQKQKKKLKKEKKLKEKEKVNDSGSNLSSDDDVPSDIDMSDPYFKEELQGSKSKKKSRKVDVEESEEVKQKKAELELLLLEENDSEVQKSHFSIKKIQDQESDTKKKKRRKQLKKKPAKEVPPEKDDFQVDVADDRFNALFTSHHFNIDPADSHYHKTKAMDTIFSEKLKRRKQDDQGFSTTKHRKTDPELLQLVQSIKNKTKQRL